MQSKVARVWVVGRFIKGLVRQIIKTAEIKK